MSDDLEPLPPLGAFARRALAAESRRPDVDDGLHERVLARVVASVAVGAAVTGVAATAQAAGTHAAAGAGAATGMTAKVLLPWVLAAFVAGGGAGAAIHAAVATAPAPVVMVTATATAPVVTVATPPSVAPSTETIAVTALPSVVAPVRSAVPAATATATTSTSTSTGGSDVELAGERALVDRARAALGRGQSGDALDALEAHAARYPRGRLSEEREALAVDALARAGRMDAARERGARFHRTYPNSVFGAVVDAALSPR